MVIELHIDIHSIIAILILVAEVQTLLNIFHILPFQVKFVFILPKNTLIYHTQCILQQIYKIYLVSNIHRLSWVNFQKEGNMPGNNLQDWTNIDFLMKIILKYNYSSWSQLFPYFCLFFYVCLFKFGNTLNVSDWDLWDWLMWFFSHQFQEFCDGKKHKIHIWETMKGIPEELKHLNF